MPNELIAVDIFSSRLFVLISNSSWASSTYKGARNPEFQEIGRIKSALLSGGPSMLPFKMLRDDYPPPRTWPLLLILQPYDPSPLPTRLTARESTRRVSQRRRELRRPEHAAANLLDEVDMRQQGAAWILLRIEDTDFLPSCSRTILIGSSRSDRSIQPRKPQSPPSEHRAAGASQDLRLTSRLTRFPPSLSLARIAAASPDALRAPLSPHVSGNGRDRSRHHARCANRAVAASTGRDRLAWR
jgi:hypothetical protein